MYIFGAAAPPRTRSIHCGVSVFGVEQRLQLRRGKDILRVAELAVHLRVPALGDHVLQLLHAALAQRLLHARTRARAAIGHWVAQDDLGLQIAHDLRKNGVRPVLALDRRKMGMSISWAAVLGAGARLRPILMTSLAMIIGLLPMMFAFGVGANGNRSLGTTAIGGMLIGMICQIFIVPVLFVIFQYLQEKVKPMTWEDIEIGEADSDIEQYSK